MQISFTPKKIKAAKAYIENLDTRSKFKTKSKSLKISFFERIKKFFKI